LSLPQAATTSSAAAEAIPHLVRLLIICIPHVRVRVEQRSRMQVHGREPSPGFLPQRSPYCTSGRMSTVRSHSAQGRGAARVPLQLGARPGRAPPVGPPC
jgi:hypothetical protein